MAKDRDPGTVFQAEKSVCRGPGVEVSCLVCMRGQRQGGDTRIMRLERSLETRL